MTGDTDLMDGGALCCAGAGIESREAGMFERLSEQRTRPCTGLEVGTALGFRAIRYGSEGGSGLVDLVDMSVAMDLSRDFTEQTPRSVSLPSSKALQKCDCGISKLELRAVVMIKTESPAVGFQEPKLFWVCVLS